MVMKRNMMRKNLRQTIWNSLGRFIAIVAIIALGSAIFVGLRITKTDMVATGQVYTDMQNMFDLRLVNSYGWDPHSVETIANLDGVVDAEGSVTMDVFANFGDSVEEEIYRLYSIPEKVNKVYLLGGRMPESADECLVDGSHAGDEVLGSKLTISTANDEDTLDSLNHHTYTVVGYVSTPLYMDMSRGSTTLGSGSLNSYVYIPMDAFAVDYYTEINVTIPGDWEVYTGAYTDAMDDAADWIKPSITPLANDRFTRLKREAEQELADGLLEYEDGLKEFEEAKAEVEQELADALKKLEEGQAEIDENRQTMEDGEQQLREAEELLEESAKTLGESRLELEKARAETYAQLAQASKELLENEKAAADGLKQVEDGLAQIEAGIPQIEDGLAQIEDGLPQLELAITLAELRIQSTQASLEAAQLLGNESLIASLEAQLAEQTEQLEEYTAQRQELVKTQAELEDQLEQLTAQKAELEQTRITLTDALSAIEDGYKELENGKLQAESEFASAEAQLQAGELELETGRQELETKKQELAEGKAALEEGLLELDEGWAEYESGKQEAEQELADAQAELQDAQVKLADARQTIDDMKAPDVYALTRNTNAGYLALDSNSDIVSGVSRVFPVFFLLIAALVCITTMTRMVDEERTQIGTLKALGYSNFKIMNKYLLYSGIAAVVGCGLGVSVGSVVFPWILWTAYGIIFNITPWLVLTFDWGLSLGVFISYTAVSTLVTWYCCRRTLKEVPAELIRPKAPTSGKKILLEYLPFWDKISFLNKVMLRNIFRYRQRLLMMLVGIGGCTALLVTGFGIRDSIVTIVDQQFETVTTFDLQVNFSEGLTEEGQTAFREELREDAHQIGFFYQTSVEAAFDSQVRDVYLVAADESIKSFISFHRDGENLDMPGTGEAFLSVGAAEVLGVSVGDTITARDTDMRQLTLKITGIYENHVNNYLIVTPETLAQQWGEAPEYQMAYIAVTEGRDVHAVSAMIGGLSNVMNITISEDQAQIVNSMMDALILVVVTIVICAGLLAVIVLYNLTNINITERIREIATIKVLGFNAGETSAYVFKENICLSVVGALLGLVGGKYLLDFVMSQIKIDMVWFLPRLEWQSYLYAVVLTILSALVVDFIFHKKLDKINMAEALKSVE